MWLVAALLILRGWCRVGHADAAERGTDGWCRLACLLFGRVLTGYRTPHSARSAAFGRRSLLAVRRLAEGNHMEANADRFLELLHQFEDFTETISPERAHIEFDETTLQLFWMRWPQVSAWTGSLWRMLSEEMSGPSAPHTDPELDEVGESG
jgi:hypothetical protein